MGRYKEVLTTICTELHVFADGVPLTDDEYERLIAICNELTVVAEMSDVE